MLLLFFPNSGFESLAQEQNAATGQSISPAAAQFEVASVKLFLPPGGRVVRGALRGGPGTSDPGLARCTGCTLEDVVLRAFPIGKFQLSGPGWLDSLQLEINAKVPLGITVEQFRLMLRNLLSERFKMTFHWVNETRQGYELAVFKDGFKVKESAEAEQPLAPGEGQGVDLGANVAIRMGAGMPTTGVTSLTTANAANMSGRKATMEQLAQALASRLAEPVVDSTGLKGKYDFTLAYAFGAPPADPDAVVPVASTPQPTLFQALKKLGLTLESKKVSFEVLVIDHVEKVPTEN
jgi:uncharacterized protein (TIGR03435 family)